MDLFAFDKPYVERLRSCDPATEHHFFVYFDKLLQIKLRARAIGFDKVEDLKQDTFIRVIAAVRKEGGIRQPERFGAFVNSICNNVLLEYYRSLPKNQQMDGRQEEDRLDSWKEIAAYLRREVRTVQRWEKTDGLPVHRLQINKQGPVYGYKSELDSWFRGREPGLEAEAKHDEGSGARTRPRMRWSIVGGLLAVAVLVSVGAYFADNGRWLNKRSAAQRIKLVVLPFQNLSGDSAQEYFSDGTTEEIITQLGKLDPERLGVIAAESSKLFTGKPIAEVGRALGVQYAIEGSVRRGGNQVRIDVQLIQVSDQTHVWADSYTRDLVDVLRVQDQVAAAVASQIRVALPVSAVGANGSAGAQSRSVNPEAHDAYLQGRFEWTRNGDLYKSIAAIPPRGQHDH